MSGGVEEQSSTATRQQLNTHDDNMERTIAKKTVTPSGHYRPRQQYTIQYNNRHHIHNKERETDRKRLTKPLYSKIYGSKAVGRRRLRTGREETKADCDCDSVSPQDWLSSAIPRRGWLSTSGVSSPSVSVGMSVGTPESAWGTTNGGVRHGNNRSMWTVCRVRFSVCLSTTTKGDLKSSMRHGPVHNRWSFRNFMRTGGRGQNSHTSWPSAKTACRDRSS